MGLLAQLTPIVAELTNQEAGVLLVLLALSAVIGVLWGLLVYIASQR